MVLTMIILNMTWNSVSLVVLDGLTTQFNIAISGTEAEDFFISHLVQKISVSEAS